MKKPIKKPVVPVLDFPHYEVSSDGKVFNTKTGRRLFGTRNFHGYIYVELHDRGRIRQVCIHTLVAEEFVPRSSPDCIQVDHINGDQCDNRCYNLEWVTPRTNIHRAISMGNHPASPLWQAKHKKAGPWKTIRHRESGR